MRNYWLKILFGAFAIFVVGMLGVTLVRTGISTVNRVVEGEGPLEIPLAFVPFTLGGERLGTIQRIVIQRDMPRQVSSVDLVVDVGDSLVAQGLEGCRLAADFESRPDQPGISVEAGKDARSPFRCLAGDSTPPEFVEFGQVVFEPGEISAPLYLTQDLVAELKEGFAGDSAAFLTDEETDSIAAETRREVDAALAEAGLSRDSAQLGRRLRDSLLGVARARLDSARRGLEEVADTNPVE